jgi:hypothetical protein
VDKGIKQCCGTGTGTAGTVTFYLSGIGTGMHYSFSSGSYIKWNKNVKKSKMRGQPSGK